MCVFLLHHHQIMAAQARGLGDEHMDDGMEQAALYDGPSMYNGNATTVPVSVQTHNLNGTHQPNPPKHRLNSVDFHGKSCRINIMLVCFMFCLGLAISILGVFMHMLGSVAERECAIWAGVPVSNVP